MDARDLTTMSSAVQTSDSKSDSEVERRLRRLRKRQLINQRFVEVSDDLK